MTLHNPHKKALTDSYKSSLYSDEAAAFTLQLLNEKGIINVGGPRESIYDFANRTGADVEAITRDSIDGANIAHDSSMNVQKMKGALLLNDQLI